MLLAQVLYVSMPGLANGAVHRELSDSTCTLSSDPAPREAQGHTGTTMFGAHPVLPQ